MGLLGGLELGLGVWLTRRYGLYGLYISVFLAQLSAVMCMYARQPLRGWFSPSGASFRREYAEQRSFWTVAPSQELKEAQRSASSSSGAASSEFPWLAYRNPSCARA